MRGYRLYLLDRAGRIERAIEGQFDTEETAAAWARAVAHNYGKELWQGGRLVLCLTMGGEAWSPSAHAG
jgi:hypothetical protein